MFVHIFLDFLLLDEIFRSNCVPPPTTQIALLGYFDLNGAYKKVKSSMYYLNII